MKKEIIKPFNLEAYKNGAKVKTRNGHEVRIICTDVKALCFPIIALVEIDDSTEVVMHLTSEGKFQRGAISDNDLVIVEEVEEPEFWSDNKNNTLSGFSIINFASDGILTKVEEFPNTEINYDIFATEKQAKSALAMARISQIMANDIENFGGVVTDEEWKERAVRKYCIYRTNNNIRTIYAYSDYYFLAFHTAEQCALFLKKYERLVRNYLMLD